VRGRVKIVLTPDEMKKVYQGDIMVSGETTPDFMPAINKAAAIVTDIGGIASHAAIVSREFNIPCIVGTKIATQVLKDGDLVEVNADLGVVKIL
jgi:pyruvate,water dikinase